MQYIFVKFKADLEER